MQTETIQLVLTGLTFFAAAILVPATMVPVVVSSATQRTIHKREMVLQRVEALHTPQMLAYQRDIQTWLEASPRARQKLDGTLVEAAQNLLWAYVTADTIAQEVHSSSHRKLLRRELADELEQWESIIPELLDYPSPNFFELPLKKLAGGTLLSADIRRQIADTYGYSIPGLTDTDKGHKDKGHKEKISTEGEESTV